MNIKALLSGIVLSLVFILPSYAADEAVAGPTPVGQKPVATPLTTRKAVQQNSILGVQQGIKYNQSSLQKQYFGNKNPISGQKPSTGNDDDNNNPPTKPTNPGGNRPYPVYPSGYWYGTYSWGRYGASDDYSTTVNNNTTYNVYQNGSSSNNNSNLNNSAQTAQKQTKAKTQAQKDDEERQYLKSKYAAILANKTATNKQMCTTMASFFSNYTNEELDRVLNDLLYLNCDIDDLRTNSIQNKANSMFNY